MSKVYLITNRDEKVRMVTSTKDKAILNVTNAGYKLGRWLTDEGKSRAPYYADYEDIDIDNRIFVLHGWIIEKELY